MATAYYRLNRIETHSDNTIRVYPEADEVFNAEDMFAFMELLMQTAEKVPFKLMFIFSDYQFYLADDARKIFKGNKEAKNQILAQAVVLNSVSLEIMFDLLLRLYHPPFPLKAFRKLEDAEKWLSSQ